GLLRGSDVEQHRIYLIDVACKLLLMGLDDFLDLLDVRGKLGLLLQNELHRSLYVHQILLTDEVYHLQQVPVFLKPRQVINQTINHRLDWSFENIANFGVRRIAVEELQENSEGGNQSVPFERGGVFSFQSPMNPRGNKVASAPEASPAIPTMMAVSTFGATSLIILWTRHSWRRQA